MNRKEFCKHHWEYYLVLEKDFLQSERYALRSQRACEGGLRRSTRQVQR